MKKWWFIALSGILVSIAVSAILLTRESSVPVIEEEATEVLMRFDDVMIFKENNLLFADLDNQNFTRAKNNEESVSLESLLDRKNVQHIPFKHFIVYQTPFLDNALDKKVGFTNYKPGKISLSVVKKFLIETFDTESGEIMRNITTIIPDEEYMKKYGGENISFLDKSTFTGIILYSALDGKIEDVYVYSEGPIKFAQMAYWGIEDDTHKKFYLSLPIEIESEEDKTDTVYTAGYCFVQME